MAKVKGINRKLRQKRQAVIEKVLRDNLHDTQKLLDQLAFINSVQKSGSNG